MRAYGIIGVSTAATAWSTGDTVALFHFAGTSAKPCALFIMNESGAQSTFLCKDRLACFVPARPCGRLWALAEGAWIKKLSCDFMDTVPPRVVNYAWKGSGSATEKSMLSRTAFTARARCFRSMFGKILWSLRFCSTACRRTCVAQYMRVKDICHEKRRLAIFLKLVAFSYNQMT